MAHGSKPQVDKYGKVIIHGKEYETVAARVQRFREKYPIESEWQLRTILVKEDDKKVIVRGEIVSPSGKVVATGHAEEFRGDGHINRTSAMENAETSAKGRALAAAGFGGVEYATADELVSALQHQYRNNGNGNNGTSRNNGNGYQSHNNRQNSQPNNNHQPPLIKQEVRPPAEVFQQKPTLPDLKDPEWDQYLVPSNFLPRNPPKEWGYVTWEKLYKDNKTKGMAGSQQRTPAQWLNIMLSLARKGEKTAEELAVLEACEKKRQEWKAVQLEKYEKQQRENAEQWLDERIEENLGTWREYANGSSDLRKYLVDYQKAAEKKGDTRQQIKAKIAIEIAKQPDPEINTGQWPESNMSDAQKREMAFVDGS